MKKIIALTLSLIMLTMSSFASTSIDRLDRNEIKSMTQEQRVLRIEQLETRVNELREVNIKELKGKEKREIKSELRYIQKELKAQDGGGGIYLSVTALLVIILLILIL